MTETPENLRGFIFGQIRQNADIGPCVSGRLPIVFGHRERKSRARQTHNTRVTAMSNYTPAQLAAYAVRITGSDLWDDIDTDSETAVIERIESLRGNEQFTDLEREGLKLIVAAYHGIAQAYCVVRNVAIREATLEEAYESGTTSYEGIIAVDDYSEHIYVLA